MTILERIREAYKAGENYAAAVSNQAYATERDVPAGQLPNLKNEWSSQANRMKSKISSMGFLESLAFSLGETGITLSNNLPPRFKLWEIKIQ